jgi:uncharacterized membrane protein YfcA
MLCLIGVITVNLFRGSRKFESMIGIERCSKADWTILSIFIVFCFSLSVHASYKVRKE